MMQNLLKDLHEELNNFLDEHENIKIPRISEMFDLDQYDLNKWFSELSKISDDLENVVNYDEEEFDTSESDQLIYDLKNLFDDIQSNIEELSKDIVSDIEEDIEDSLLNYSPKNVSWLIDINEEMNNLGELLSDFQDVVKSI